MPFSLAIFQAAASAKVFDSKYHSYLHKEVHYNDFPFEKSSVMYKPKGKLQKNWVKEKT